MKRTRTEFSEAHRLDLELPCPGKACLAPVGKECLGLEPGIVHIGRRVKRLLTGARAVSEKSN